MERRTVRGTLVHDYFVCHRAVWYSHRRVDMESDLLALGRMVHERAYRGETKNVFGEGVSFDILREENGEVVVCEIKKSSRMLEAARWQLLYYLHYLKSRGIAARGLLLIPLERRRIEVVLTDEEERRLNEILEDIAKIVGRDRPPKPRWKKICKKCSYFELCWV